MAGGVNTLSALQGKVDANHALVVALEGPVSLTPFDQPPGLSWFDYTVARRSTTGLPTVYNTDGSAFDVADLRPSGGTSYYVATTGSDTTGDGSEGNPWATVSKALTVVTSPSNNTIYVAAGTYLTDAGFFGAASINFGETLSVIGVGSVVVSGHQNQTWTLNTGSTYETTVGGYTWDSVWDAAVIDSYGDFERLTSRASIALVDANPGSYYINGTTVYVRTSDSRSLIGDTDIRAFNSQPNITVAGNGTLYLENITFHNHRPNVQSGSAGQFPVFYAKNATFKYRNSNGLGASGATYIVQDTTWARMAEDGINSGDLYRPSYGIEINTTSRDNGWTAAVTSNGSSAHDTSQVVRVGGEYARNKGPNVVDVGTTVSWTVGVWAHDSNSGLSTTSDSDFFAQGLMWLDSVVSTGSTYSLVVNTTDPAEGLRVRNVTMNGAVSVDAGGALLPW
jgi:hypothetical protein